MVSKRRNKKRLLQQQAATSSRPRGATSASGLPPPPSARELTAVSAKLRKVKEFREKEAAKKRAFNEVQNGQKPAEENLSKLDTSKMTEKTKKGKDEDVSQQFKQNNATRTPNLLASGNGLSGSYLKAERDKNSEPKISVREGEVILSSSIGTFQEASLAGEKRDGERGGERDNGDLEREGGERELSRLNEECMETGVKMEGGETGSGRGEAIGGVEGERGDLRGEVEGDIAGERGRDAIDGGGEGGHLEEDEGVVEEKREKKRKRKVKIGDLRVENIKEEGETMKPKSKLNEKKKKYLENKKMKKKLKGQQDQEFEIFQPKVKFGEVVTAPLKNLQNPRKKGGAPASATSAHATSASGTAHHWPESMGIRAASNERLREIAVSMYRKARNWDARPGSAKLSEPLVELE